MSFCMVLVAALQLNLFLPEVAAQAISRSDSSVVIQRTRPSGSLLRTAGLAWENFTLVGIDTQYPSGQHLPHAVTDGPNRRRA